MLDRIALHQTRLRTPNVSLDAKGIALGAKGLVLLPSLDRLVGFLALYSSSTSLADIVNSLHIEVVRSKLGGREVIMTFNADSSDRMDRVGELARLSGGFTFTGTKRHFVQYRDAGAPFGYDLREISPTDSAICLNHTTFTQDYEPERAIDLSALVLQLEPRMAPSTARQPGARWICTEAGLGPALIHYFVRSLVKAEVGVAEWPPESGFDTTPLRRYLFKVDEVPERMNALLQTTPGIGVYAPTGPGSGVEIGFRHPINLRACPIFPREGMVLFRGAGKTPINVKKLPTMGPVDSFARIHMIEEKQRKGTAEGAQVGAVAVPLRLAPDTDPWRNITAARVRKEDLGLLRQLAYRLSRHTLEETKVCFSTHGAFLLRTQGIESIPVGQFFRQVHEHIYVAAGFCPAPAISPNVLYRAFGSPTAELLFLDRDGNRYGVPRDSFVSLDQALLDSQTWQQLTAETVAATLAVKLPEVVLDSPGMRPMRDVEPARGDDGAGP